MKSLINIPLLKEQLKRFWAISAAFMLIYLLLGVLTVYNTSAHHWLSIDFQQANNITILLSMQHQVTMWMMIISPLCVGLALFTYHFNRSASAAYYSFPITKSQLFWAEIVVALILMLLPLLIFCLILLAPIYYPGPETWDATVERPNWRFIMFSTAIFPQEIAVGSVINTPAVVAGFFARVAIGIIFYFSVLKLAVSVSGNRVVAVLLAVVIPFIPVGIHMLIDMIGNVYVLGHVGLSSTQIYTTFAFTNPAFWGELINTYVPIEFHTPYGNRLLHLGVEPRLWVNYLIYTVITVALITLSYFCTHKRKLERTGDSVVFTVINNICVFLVSATGMIFTGAFIMNMFRGRIVGMYIGLVLGFIIFYFVAQMIAEKSFNVIHKLKDFLRYGGIMAGMYVIMLLIINFGMSAYINRVPEAPDVAGVSLSSNMRWIPVNERHNMYVSDSDSIARILEAHQYILANQQQLQRMRRQAMDGRWFGLTIPFTYLLNDGTTMYRRYDLSTDFVISSGLGDLMKSTPIILAEFPVLLHPEAVENVHIRIWNEDMVISTNIIDITYNSNITSLFEALREDYVASVMEFWENRLSPELDHHVQTVMRPRIMDIDIRVFEQYWTRYGWRNFGTTGEHTLEWLEANGYLE
ncbi:MAG: hypothetical protein FWC91_00105 [Defluviitaleaceae bacterium]|nr:hypothetical protein [Defluviitaleaceae bacterium]